MATTSNIAWSDNLSTGLASVDHQHQRLVEIINTLSNLHAQGSTVQEIAPVLAQLRDYTLFHFQHEADLMELWPVNAADKAAHLKAHHGFVERIKKAEELVASNPADVVDHLLSFLLKWLVHHITGIDTRMAREINALSSGIALDQAGMAENPLHAALVDTVSDLYDSIGERTFEVLELNYQLQTYYDRQEEENALAQSIILRQMNHGELSGKQLHYWFSPSTTFSGDIVAAMPDPEGRLYVMIADATGHGLAAAITVLPVLSTFHSMAERGCPVGEILAEINRNLRATLPADRFVAAAMMHVDEEKNLLEVWNGGMPDLLLLSPDDEITQKIGSTHLPLGILDFEPDTSATTKITWQPGSQFVMYSDGLLEAANQAGEMFGAARLSKALQASPAGQRLTAVQHALTEHAGSVVPHDDITLVLVDYT